ncbi:unnamed protein product [Prunus armeniaca]
MASSSSRPKRFNLNVAPKTTRDAKRRSHEEAINDSIAFSIQSAASISDMANCLLAIANEIQEMNTENSSLRRMLHDSQQEVENFKNENKALLKLISNGKIMKDQDRLMAKLKRRRSLSLETSRS